jgi:hypothetical protein
MARPPEPLASVLPFVEAAVFAHVVSVVDGGEPSVAAVKKYHRDVATGSRPQRVVLEIDEVLRAGFGAHQGQRLEVEKPSDASYALLVGHKGPFLLGKTDSLPVILGRYGPDTYAHNVLRAAFSR